MDKGTANNTLSALLLIVESITSPGMKPAMLWRYEVRDFPWTGWKKCAVNGLLAGRQYSTIRFRELYKSRRSNGENVYIALIYFCNVFSLTCIYVHKLIETITYTFPIKFLFTNEVVRVA
jgi:hypothetical protein